MPDSTPKIQALKALKERALQRGVKVKLASGRESDIYVDCKRASLHGPSLKHVSAAFTEVLRAQAPQPAMIAGVSVGGDPLVAGILLEAAAQGWELEGLLVRKEAKSHGLAQGRTVDGPLPRAGAPVWLVEDVVSTGGSSLQALGSLKREGYDVKGMVCLVDREMGGVAKLSQDCGIPVLSIFKLSDLS